jgi:hypothetical protein
LRSDRPRLGITCAAPRFPPLRAPAEADSGSEEEEKEEEEASEEGSEGVEVDVAIGEAQREQQQQRARGRKPAPAAAKGKAKAAAAAKGKGKAAAAKAPARKTGRADVATNDQGKQVRPRGGWGGEGGGQVVARILGHIRGPQRAPVWPCPRA